MTKAEKIVAYIKDCFEMFSMNLEEFFYYDFADAGWDEILWTDEAGKLIPGIVEFSSEILGISEKNIRSCNNKVIRQRLKQYPYIWEISAFDEACRRVYYGKEYDRIRLAEVIFDVKSEKPYPLRYDYQNVKKRMLNQLKEMNRVMPGAFHENASIRDLRICTKNFCHFENIQTMTESFIDMVEKLDALFLKAVHSTLSHREVLEYNFLVTIMGLRDRSYPKGYLYYSNVEKARDIYSNISKENIREYTVLKKALDFSPWLCADFVNDTALVKRYLTVVPEAKGHMREYAMKAAYFECSFIWSDAGPRDSSEMQEFCNDFYRSVGEEPIAAEQWPREITTVYVKKTREELNGDDTVAEKLLQYCRPAKAGGIKVDTSLPTNEDTRRLIKLFGKIKPNSFMERHLNEVNHARGTAYERE